MAVFTIIAETEGVGSIVPSGAVNVAKGGSVTFSIMSDGIHTIRDVEVDTVSVGAVATYVFNNVQENHRITAHFNLDYSDLPVTAGTKTYATYQNYIRSALIERAAKIGAGITPPAVINAGDPIESTLGPWITACRNAVEDIIAANKYGDIVGLTSTEVVFREWDLFGDGPNEGHDLNGLLHFVHQGLQTFGDDAYINDIYTVTAGAPIAGISNLFCSENSDVDGGTGLLGTLKAIGPNHVAFKSRNSTQYGPPVEMDNNDRANIYDNPRAFESDSQVITKGIVRGGSYSSTTLIDQVYFKVSPDGEDPLDVQLLYTVTGTGTVYSVKIFAKYGVADTVVDKSVTVKAWNYVTSTWTTLGTINPGLDEEADSDMYTFSINSNNYKDINGVVKIRLISEDSEDTSILYIDYADLFYETSSSRFVRVKRTAAADLTGTGNIFATANNYDDHRWMYYDAGELNPLYRGYFREIWFCIELMKFVEFVPSNWTVTNVSSKGATSDNEATELAAFADASSKFSLVPWGGGGGPPTGWDSAAETLGDETFGFVCTMGASITTGTVPNPGADISIIYMPLVLDVYGNITARVAWGGGVKLGEFTLGGGRYRSYLSIVVSPGPLPVSKTPTLPPDMAPNSGVRENFDFDGTWYRNGVKGYIFTYQDSNFFEDAANPPTEPPN